MLQRNPEHFHPEPWWLIVLQWLAVIAVIFGGWMLVVAVLLALVHS